jgi:F-type H+-transporting ATPase subunit delta
MKVKHAVLALYDIALENDTLEKVMASLENVNVSLNEDIIDYLDAPTVDMKDKQHVLDTFQVDPYTKGLLNNLLKYRQIHQFDNIYKTWVSNLRELNKVYFIDVYVAKKLTSQQSKILEKQLMTYFQASQVVIQEHLEPNVMGGIKIMYQKQTLDHTVLEQFQQMEMMV